MDGDGDWLMRSAGGCKRRPPAVKIDSGPQIRGLEVWFLQGVRLKSLDFAEPGHGDNLL